MKKFKDVIKITANRDAEMKAICERRHYVVSVEDACFFEFETKFGADAFAKLAVADSFVGNVKRGGEIIDTLNYLLTNEYIGETDLERGYENLTKGASKKVGNAEVQHLRAKKATDSDSYADVMVRFYNTYAEDYY